MKLLPKPVNSRLLTSFWQMRSLSLVSAKRTPMRSSGVMCHSSFLGVVSSSSSSSPSTAPCDPRPPLAHGERGALKRSGAEELIERACLRMSSVKTSPTNLLRRFSQDYPGRWRRRRKAPQDCVSVDARMLKVDSRCTVGGHDDLQLVIVSVGACPDLDPFSCHDVRPSYRMSERTAYPYQACTSRKASLRTSHPQSWVSCHPSKR
jgi:hypothetical protein